MEISDAFSRILTHNSALQAILKTAAKVSLSDVNILLTGESGTGKNALSRAIHETSRRHEGPFVSVNCMAMPETLIESELFGHEKGAFTNAVSHHKGSFEIAHRGTIFLDEIGDMTVSAQGKILQAIEEKHFKKLGSETSIDSDIRVISATNRDLRKRIEDGVFREDLYYRLREVELHLPPLRQRKEDIPLLIKHFIQEECRQLKKPELKISDAALSYLVQYSWPGNIRELRNVIKSAVILCGQDTLWLEHFPFELQLASAQQNAVSSDRDFSIEGTLKRHIQAALEYYGWNKKKTAAALSISRPRLDRYLQKFSLQNEKQLPAKDGKLPAA